MAYEAFDAGDDEPEEVDDDDAAGAESFFAGVLEESADLDSGLDSDLVSDFSLGLRSRFELDRLESLFESLL